MSSFISYHSTFLIELVFENSFGSNDVLLRWLSKLTPTHHFSKTNLVLLALPQSIHHLIMFHQQKLAQSVREVPTRSVHFWMLILSSDDCLYFQWLSLMDVKTCTWMFFWIVLLLLNHHELLQNLLHLNVLHRVHQLLDHHRHSHVLKLQKLVQVLKHLKWYEFLWTVQLALTFNCQTLRHPIWCVLIL